MELSDVLNNLSAQMCSREEWLKVGMAMKHEGMQPSDWDAWSRSDSRYHEGECERLWRGFHGGGASPVTAGTIVQIAREHGCIPSGFDRMATLGWDDYISYDGDDFEAYHAPESWSQADDIVTYLQTLFHDDEYVGFVVHEANQREDGKWIPGGKGVFHKTAGEIIKSVMEHPDDIGWTFGDPVPDAGAWIRFNPLDGNGVGNSNVTRFTYALVESDTLPIQEQEFIFKKLELPIALLVHSGGKSLHAIVKVEAKDAAEYQKRVAFLYDYLAKEGVEIDKQNSNPSRLSRFPGFMRGEKRQYIVAKDIGRASWASWMDFAEGEMDELPDIVNWANVKDNPPELEPELISGILRQGHKMMVSAASKAGKSYLMVELAVKLAEGLDWLGFQCRKSKVLYCNFEIADASFFRRISDVYERLRLEPRNAKNIDVWNLRGNSMGMGQFAAKLIRRVKHAGDYDAIIIDPIYKVQDGDENEARAISAFCNSLDMVCQQTGCSVIYVHHHSKGDKTGAKAIDRASGSGVFARDADALIDLTEIDLSDAERERMVHGDAPAFVVSTVLREFKNVPQKYIWFEWPIHIEDETGDLKNHCRQPGTGETFATESGKAAKSADKNAQLWNAYDYLSGFNDGPVTTKEMESYFDGQPGFSLRTIQRFFEQNGLK